MHERDERDERVGRDSALVLPRLRRARRERGWSMQDLAKRSGVSKATIIRIEGGNKARISTAGKLADALGVGVAALSGGAERGAGRSVADAARENAAGLPGEVVLALASRRSATEAGGEDVGFDLVEVLGGAESYEDFGRALDRARAAGAMGIGLKDHASAPVLPLGGGLSEEVTAQRMGFLNS